MHHVFLPVLTREQQTETELHKYFDLIIGKKTKIHFKSAVSLFFFSFLLVALLLKKEEKKRITSAPFVMSQGDRHRGHVYSLLFLVLSDLQGSATPPCHVQDPTRKVKAGNYTQELAKWL